MSRLRKLFMGLVVAALCLVLMEGGARLLTGAPTPPFVASIPAAGESGDWLSRGEDGWVQATYQNRFAINPFPAEPGEHPRVLWVGGSSVRGGRGKSRPAFEMPGVTALKIGDAEILNLGAPGLDTRHIWAMTPELLALKPQALVVYTGHNDLGNVLFEDSVPTESAARAMRVRSLLRRSRIFELMERGEENISGLRVGEAKDAPARERMSSLTELQKSAVLTDFERRLRWIVRAAQKEGVQVILVTVVSDARSPSAQWRCPELMRQAGFGGRPGGRMPHKVRTELLEGSDCPDARWLLAYQGMDSDPEAASAELIELRDSDPWSTRAGRPTNDIIRRVAQEEGAVLVDMAAIAQEQGGGVEPSDWFTDPIHLSRSGHKAIAEQVAPVLAQELGLELVGGQAPPPPAEAEDTGGVPLPEVILDEGPGGGPPPPGGRGPPPPDGQHRPPPGGHKPPPPGGHKPPPPGGHKPPPPGGFHGQAPGDKQ